MMKIGMSLACLYPMEPELAVDEAARIGVDVAEVFLNTMSELEDSYLYMLREKCDRNGIKIHSLHPFTSALENYLFFSRYPRRIADATLLYERYARAAKILGAKVINIHGDRGMGLDSLESYVNCIAPLLKIQEKTDIFFSMENVYFNSVNHPEFTYRLRRAVPEVRFTLDIKQAFKGGQDAYLLAEAMGENIINFHINDRDDEHICLLPGSGSIDYKRIGEILEKANYQGPALIEVYRHNFKDMAEIQRSKELLENKFFLAK